MTSSTSKTTEESLRNTPFRKNVECVLVKEKVGPEEHPIYSIGVSNSVIAAEDIYNLLTQILETNNINCEIINRVTLPSGQTIKNVHPESDCEGRGCAIHHPSNHHMVKFSQVWDDKSEKMSRVCSHGVSHPDPDQVASDGNRSFAHNCCRKECCKVGI